MSGDVREDVRRCARMSGKIGGDVRDMADVINTCLKGYALIRVVFVIQCKGKMTRNKCA